MSKVWLTREEMMNEDTKIVSFWHQFEAIKTPNYSALETLFELEIKEKNRPNKISNYQ